MTGSNFVFAGGGTGGHLYPGLAVAEMLKRLLPTAAITFLTTDRPLDRDLISRTVYEQVPQSVRPFTTNLWQWPKFYSAWRKSVAAATALLEEKRPQAVVGLGGYAAGPGVVAARKLGIRTAILNPDAIPGRANRYLAKRTDLVVMQWDDSRAHFPKNANCRTLGCPIRAAFTLTHHEAGATIKGVPVQEALWDGAEGAKASRGRSSFGLAYNRPVLLVTGASQGARTVNESVTRIWPEFLKRFPDWQLLHLTGTADEAATRKAYDRANLPRSSTHVQAFTHEMWNAIAAADVVISRAGASTLAELTALGKPGILLPYPFHKDRHQHANAEVLVRAGAAVLVEDTKDAETTAGPLLTALVQFADARKREKMSAAALTLARPAAAESVARWMLGESSVEA